MRIYPSFFGLIVLLGILQFHSTCHAFDVEIEMEDMDKTYLEFVNLNNANRDLETIIENYASSVVLISIWLMSREYAQLKLFLKSFFDKLLPNNYKLLIAFVGVMSAMNCIYCVIRIR